MERRSLCRLVLAAGCLLLSGAPSLAAIVNLQDVQASTDLGRSMAQADKVRQLAFVHAGGVINGTTTPMGPRYTAMSYHYFTYYNNNVGAGVPYTLQVSTGPSWAERSQTLTVTDYLVHPTLDFVLLKHDAVTDAVKPTFGTIARHQVATFVGFGEFAHFGASAFVHDGNAHAWRMRAFDVNSPNEYEFAENANSSSGAFTIGGGGVQFDSSSAGYTSAGQLAVFVDNGAYQLSNPPVSVGAIPFVASGLATWINANTPLNTAPPGDTNYDERVNFDDLLALAQHYGTPAGMTWWDGDFTADAAVNFDDLLILAQHYGDGVAVVDGATASFNADWTLAQSMVPEPSVVLLFTITGFTPRGRSRE